MVYGFSVSLLVWQPRDTGSWCSRRLTVWVCWFGLRPALYEILRTGSGARLELPLKPESLGYSLAQCFINPLVQAFTLCCRNGGNISM